MAIDLLEPKEFTVGNSKYLLHKFPAVQGREIVAKYPIAALPKLGDYGVSEETMLKLMNFVCAEKNGKTIRLENRTLVDNHVASWEVLAKIEVAMMEYNCSFFTNGKASDFLEGVAQKFLSKISEMLINSSVPSLQQEKQPITNSEQSIP